MGPELVVAGTRMGIGLRKNVAIVASGGADAPGVGKDSALGIFKTVPIGYGRKKGTGYVVTGAHTASTFLHDIHDIYI